MEAARAEPAAHHHRLADHSARHGKAPRLSGGCDVRHRQPLSLIGAAGFIELIGGALLIIGLCTRPVAFILAGMMAFAYFIGHMFKGGVAAPVFHPLLNGGTLAALYCFACLYLATAGAGPWSVDASMKKA